MRSCKACPDATVSGSYLNVGQEYDLAPHEPASYSELWEIPTESTKRPDSSSQVLLYDWKDEAPGMEGR